MIVTNTETTTNGVTVLTTSPYKFIQVPFQRLRLPITVMPFQPPPPPGISPFGFPHMYGAGNSHPFNSPSGAEETNSIKGNAHPFFYVVDATSNLSEQRAAIEPFLAANRFQNVATSDILGVNLVSAWVDPDGIMVVFLDGPCFEAVVSPPQLGPIGAIHNAAYEFAAATIKYADRVAFMTS